MVPAVLWLCTALVVAAQQDPLIGVVETRPELAAQLAAAVDVALRHAVIDGGEGDGGGDGGGDDGGDGVPPPTAVAPVEPNEPLALPAHVCLLANEGVSAVVSGGGDGSAAAARSGLLLLTVEQQKRTGNDPALLHLYPHPDVLAEACADLCEAKGWLEAVVLHEGSGRALPPLLRAPLSAATSSPASPTRSAIEPERVVLRARQLPPLHDDDALRNLLLVLKKWGASKFIVWCGSACGARVLDAAQRVGLLGERHSYLLPALDLHTLPLAAFSHGGANITVLQLFDPEWPLVRRVMAAWRREYERRLEGAADSVVLDQLVAQPPSALLLAYDAARLVTESAARLALPQPGGTGAEPPSCATGAAAFHADTLLNYIRSMEWGVASSAGVLAWGAGGDRRDAALRVAELQSGGALRTAAAWSARDRLAWLPRDPAPPPRSDLMTNRTFVVLIAENKPYVMRQQSVERLSGNSRYEGFCIELIDRLATLLNFNYTFVEQPDGKYGSRNKTTGLWDGMLRRLIDDPSVHFAVTDLTITAEREEAVDFTTPFMNLGISILFRKPKPPEPKLFAFLLPFSHGVWLCLGLAYVGTSLVLYVVGRLCPEEWQNPYPCIEEPDALENQFTIANALWFNLGAVLLQGSEIAPVAYGTRAVASAWWMFALVMTSSYTANLATLLATKTSTELIHNVRDLVDNPHGITYGAKAGGSTFTFFELSNNELYRRMFTEMTKQEMPLSNEEGIQKVMKEQYAFLAESTTIEYTIERNCEVTMVGEQLDSKGYGIAMKKNSEYRHSLNLALLNLQESGILREMKHRWWKEKHGGGACQPDEDPASELRTANFLGLFLVLVVGCALGLAVSCCDLAWRAWRHPRDPTRSFTASFLSELRFVFRFEHSEKPLRGALTPPAAPSPSTPPTSSPASAPASPSPSPRSRSHSPSPRSRSPGPRRRSGARRCSMHTASVRLARHTTPRRAD
ncbi:glutamate receptor ionotropic, kainate 2-like isoform X2 [Leptidea sinapis]|uniref:glutamate receptor ionotropic, kainate 2-like isoform X2 n=1 Tax=Leptidea sinapis TaxID=189913 RepID=UPI0021309836|nr:glutamate receptor ionotropic, kainate 2-like isoform X2 [Leptidea sinapis]